MSKKDAKKHQSDKKEVDAVKNQLFENYQNGVVEGQLENNKGIHHFNNQKK